MQTEQPSENVGGFRSWIDGNLWHTAQQQERAADNREDNGRYEQGTPGECGSSSRSRLQRVGSFCVAS